MLLGFNLAVGRKRKRGVMVNHLMKMSTAVRREKTCKFMLEIFRKKMNFAMINVSMKRYVSFWSPFKNIDLEDRTTTMFRVGVNLL